METVQPHLKEIIELDKTGGAGQQMVFALGYAQGILYDEAARLRQNKGF